MKILFRHEARNVKGFPSSFDALMLSIPNAVDFVYGASRKKNNITGLVNYNTLQRCREQMNLRPKHPLASRKSTCASREPIIIWIRLAAILFSETRQQRVTPKIALLGFFTSSDWQSFVAISRVKTSLGFPNLVHSCS